MIFLLLVLYQLKHFVCDYPLQGKYMLGKFKPGLEWVFPLLAHSAVHGVATFAIAWWIKPELAVWLGLLDMSVHFCVDRVKASPNLLGRFKPLSAEGMMDCQRTLAKWAGGPLKYDAERKIKSNKYFWWALGADQTAHHLTHYAIIWALL